ncbi:hypothetical protein I8Y06_003314 [Photobacterium damselae]|nr:hypothetical protein [Photobacterium damselae]
MFYKNSHVSNDRFEHLVRISQRKTKPEMIEAARLVVVDSLTQKQAAKKMNVAVTSLNRYIASLSQLDAEIYAYYRMYK